MSHLPLATDAAIQKRFVSLISEGPSLLATMVSEGRDEYGREYATSHGPFETYRTKVLNLIAYLGRSPQLTGFADEIRKMDSTPSQMDRLFGLVRGLSDDYHEGFLDSILRRAEAEVAADYLGQAEQLLVEGQSGKFDHVPAAVLLGAVLEKALRTLCGRQSPPLPLVDPSGRPKMINGLIDDLKKADALHELKAKQLRLWAGIRNAAAHGDFDAFKKADVEAMRLGIQSFLADHL
jgi:hypothetical protein